MGSRDQIDFDKIAGKIKGRRASGQDSLPQPKTDSASADTGKYALPIKEQQPAKAVPLTKEEQIILCVKKAAVILASPDGSVPKGVANQAAGAYSREDAIRLLDYAASLMPQADLGSAPIGQNKLFLPNARQVVAVLLSRAVESMGQDNIKSDNLIVLANAVNLPDAEAAGRAAIADIRLLPWSIAQLQKDSGSVAALSILRAVLEKASALDDSAVLPLTNITNLNGFDVELSTKGDYTSFCNSTLEIVNPTTANPAADSTNAAQAETLSVREKRRLADSTNAAIAAEITRKDSTARAEKAKARADSIDLANRTAEAEAVPDSGEAEEASNQATDEEEGKPAPVQAKPKPAPAQSPLQRPGMREAAEIMLHGSGGVYLENQNVDSAMTDLAGKAVQFMKTARIANPPPELSGAVFGTFAMLGADADSILFQAIRNSGASPDSLLNAIMDNVPEIAGGSLERQQWMGDNFLRIRQAVEKK